MKTHRLASSPGDGIGVDVTDAAMAVVEATARKYGFGVQATRFDWSCAYYQQTGAMMPADGIETLRGFDAIYLGAVGWPESVPDAVSLHGFCCRSARPSTNTPISARIVCCRGSRGR